MDRIANRYQVLGVLGSGAMAEVYEVMDESRGSVVALKRLLRERADHRLARVLLKREYQTLTELSHPLIIRAFDYGQDGDLPFYTMERLTGQSVGDLAPLPCRGAASIVRDVASALSLVHSRRLVHRDVSSRNVCRTEDGRAKLLDFGALAPMGPAREIVGTPPFLCPESLEQRPLDGRTDLFSLGALAYLLLTGRHAYPARRIADLGEIWQRPVEPPSALAADVPRALDELVLALLAMNPLARPGSAAEVCDRLTAIAGLPPAETPEAARSYFLTPSLVARGDQTQRFRRRLLRAERARGSAMLIESPPGCGRSRLLSSLLLEARLRGAIVVWADAGHAPPRPFGVVRALGRSLRDAEPSLAEDVTLADPGLARILGLELGSSEAPIEPASWIPATECVSRYLTETSRKRPVVIGIDNLEACDGPSAAVLTALSEAAPSEALLLVATSLAGATDPAAARWRERGHSLRLEPFTEADTRALLASVFGDVVHLDEVAGWAHRLSLGVPRTALDLAQHLVDCGLARYGDGGWVLPASLEGLDLPDGMDATLDARVAALGVGARRIAEVLALTSDEDPLLVDEYPVVLDEGARDALFSHLNELVSASVLVDAGTSYVFANRDIRAAVVRGAAPEELAALHRRIAEAYRSGPTPADDLAAHHLLQAGDPESAFRLAAHASSDRTDLFARGLSFLRTPEAARTLETLLEWGRAHAAAGPELAHVGRAIMQLASLGDVRLVRHAPAILEALRYDAGLDLWQELADVEDPLERLQRAIGGAYARYSSLPDRERHLDPMAAVAEIAVTAASAVGGYARNADHLSAGALDELVRPLRVLSPALDVVGRLVELAARSLRGNFTRDLRVHVIEQTAAPVPGLDEASRTAIHILSLYYLALEDTTQGHPVPDDRLSPLDGSAPYAPLAWQARMLREYYLGDEKKAEECRRRRDVAMTGRADVDGHLDTSVLYEVSAYASLGNLMALKRIVPILEERSKDRPGWRPHYQLALGNCHFLRGDHERAALEYERGLALPNSETHAGRGLIAIRLVRSLTELGRADEARAHAVAALARDDVERMIPYYRNQLELGLALAEARLGEGERARDRAEACMEEVDRRGVVGVVLVTLLVEHATLMHRLGRRERFEELTRRVGDLVAGTNSAALATQHARLLSMQRSTTFEPLAPRVGEVRPDTVFTALAASVRTELERCKGPSERSRLALEFLMTHAGARRGFLYVCRADGLECAAAIPECEPTPTLDERVTQWVSDSFGAGDEKTESVEEISVRSDESAFRLVELVTKRGGEVVLAGVVALEPIRGALSEVPGEVSRAVGDELLRTGDAAGMRVLTG